jgi:hypothetical protein
MTDSFLLTASAEAAGVRKYQDMETKSHNNAPRLPQ